MKHFAKPLTSIGDVLARVERRERAMVPENLRRWREIVMAADGMARDMAQRDGWRPKSNEPFYRLKDAKARKYWKRTGSALTALFGIDLELVVMRMRVQEKALEIERLRRL